MINEKRLKCMIRLAEYEQGQGAEDLKIRRYARRDYLVIQLIRTFVLTTLGFVLLLALVGIGNMTFLMDRINQVDLTSAAVLLLVLYGAFLAAYLIITLGVALSKYQDAGESVSEYEDQIRYLEKLYRRQRHDNV